MAWALFAGQDGVGAPFTPRTLWGGGGGGRMAWALFAWHPHSRGEVLLSLFDGVAEHAHQPAVQQQPARRPWRTSCAGVGTRFATS